jgi:hypothetical protein
MLNYPQANNLKHVNKHLQAGMNDVPSTLCCWVVTITQDFGLMDYSLSEDNGMLVYHGNLCGITRNHLKLT